MAKKITKRKEFAMTPIAEWLNSFFAGFDYAILEAYHNFTKATGGFFTPFIKFFTFLGNKGWFLIVLALGLFMFSKTRKTAVAMALAIIFGALIVNITVKPLVARPRPFVANETFRLWWEYVGAMEVSEYSFPSGHTNASVAVMLAFAVTSFKRWKWAAPAALAFAVLMGFTRNYVMVHYPSDVLFGFLTGAVAGILGVLVAKFGFWFLEKYRSFKLFGFVLDADLAKLWKKEKAE